jgi:hypothetical protein
MCESRGQKWSFGRAINARYSWKKAEQLSESALGL